MYCKMCGENNADGEKLCSKCGAELFEEMPEVDKNIQPEKNSNDQTEIENTDLNTEEIDTASENEETNKDASLDEWLSDFSEDEASLETEESEESGEAAEKKKNSFLIFINNNLRIINISLVIILVLLIGIFYKSVFYETCFTTAKVMKHVDEGKAVSIARTAYNFLNLDECKTFINSASTEIAKKTIYTDPDKAISVLKKAIPDDQDTTNSNLLVTAYYNKAQKNLDTDIDKAIAEAKAGLNETKSDELQMFIDNANALKDYAKTYGSPFIGSIGDTKISISEYNVFLHDVMTQIEKNANVAATDAAKISFWSGEIQGKKAVDFAKDQAMTNLRQFVIQLVKARESNTVIDQAQLSSTLTQISQYQQTLGTGSAAENAFGVGLRQFQSVYRDIMLVQKFEQNQVESVKPTDAEMKQYYDKNKDTLDSVTVVHVLLLTSDSKGKPLSAKAQAEAKKKADDIYAKLKAGADITALAKQYSQDPGVTSNNGQYTFKKGQMVPEFENWAFKAKPGDIGIVKSSYGYHVMKFIKRTTYADITKTDITQAMGRAKLKTLIDSLEKDKKNDIKKDQKIIDEIKVI